MMGLCLDSGGGEMSLARFPLMRGNFALIVFGGAKHQPPRPVQLLMRGIEANAWRLCLANDLTSCQMSRTT